MRTTPNDHISREIIFLFAGFWGLGLILGLTFFFTSRPLESGLITARLGETVTRSALTVQITYADLEPSIVENPMQIKAAFRVSSGLEQSKDIALRMGESATFLNYRFRLVNLRYDAENNPEILIEYRTLNP